MKIKACYTFQIFILISISTVIHSCRNYDPFERELRNLNAKLSVEIAGFDNAHLLTSKTTAFKLGDNNITIDKDGQQWLFQNDLNSVPEIENAYNLSVNVTLKSGVANESTVGIRMDFDDWSVDNYVLFPAAAYNGNRYKGRAKKRKEFICEATECGPDMDLFMTDPPRLNYKEGPSAIQLLSGDMATPAIAIHSKNLKKGILILTEQGTELGDFSFKIEENEDRSAAFVVLRMPGIREDSCFMGTRSKLSPDRAHNFKAGDNVNLKFRFYFFDSPDVQSVFQKLIEVRKDIGSQELNEEIPFSAVWSFQQDKYNQQNWVEEAGYYSVGMRENPYQDWQTGWTGGMNAVYPLLLNGNEYTRQRVLRTFDFLYDSVSPSGFFYDVYHNGSWFNKENNAFLRRNSDALYFIMKSYSLINEIYPEYEIPEKWNAAARNCADAYVRLFKKYGQFGQWIDNQNGEIIAGGTASNGIACGALALCAEYYNNDEYLEVAKDAAKYYYDKYVSIAVTNGGPGDVWQCPDSESAFGLLESYIILYELTSDKIFLDYAVEIANQAASWVVSYNFKFPENSTFAKLGMQTNGTVIANVNNKHSAPGICTLSGNSLFKLYRFTGNQIYLDLAKDIARSIPQYMSREDRPIPDIRPDQPVPVMPAGWINERVNMSDWEERGTPGDIKRGEIFGGSCWSEVASMLSYAEIPGLYIVNDLNVIVPIDHIRTELVENNDSSIIIDIFNPTEFDAKIRVFKEYDDEKTKPLPKHYLLDCEVLDIVSQGKTRYIIRKK